MAKPEISLEQVYLVQDVLVWNHLAAWRRLHALPPSASKKLDDLDADTVLDLLSSDGLASLDHGFLASSSVALKRRIAEQMVLGHPESYKGYARLAEVCEGKTALLAFARVADLNPALLSSVVPRMKRLRDQASYGPTATSSELMSLGALEPLLQTPWSDALHTALGSTFWPHPTVPRTRQVYTAELPRNFSHIYPRIAGMSAPRREADVDLLRALGFTHILSLTAESPLPASWFEFKLTHVFVPVPNYQPPTLAEMDAILARVMDGGRWVVHCGGGVGRAGTVLACLIAMLGDGDDVRDGGTPVLDAKTAIARVRAARPKSIETEAQEAFVTRWVSHRWKRHSALEEPHTGLKVEGSVPRPLCALMLIGKPGSGKSWFAGALAKRRPGTVVVNQDESSRSACERQAARRVDGLVILDRCNPTLEDRTFWRGLLGPCVAVYFDYPPELCAQRMGTRLDHPTIRAGRGRGALAQMHREMQPPTLEEGWEAILTVSSFSAAREAIRLLGGEVGLLKFPRTPHAFDLGAATRDDIVLHSAELRGVLSVEEKIDGANMGISLDFGGRLRVQNRSHWVCSADHAQFRPLDRWLASHEPALRKILDRDAQFPERHILYGEWVVARHSVLYDCLPGEFVAFDLYDRLEGFASRRVLERALLDSGIPQVPLLRECALLSREEVLGMLERKSAFGSQRLEGVYIRFEDEGRTHTVAPAKVVRADFIAGNEHWAKRRIELNGIVR